MMKRFLAVACLVFALGSIALADGSGPPPDLGPQPRKPPVIQVADGSGPPPVSPTKKPPVVVAG
jgi:hypothetical protein